MTVRALRRADAVRTALGASAVLLALSACTSDGASVSVSTTAAAATISGATSGPSTTSAATEGSTTPTSPSSCRFTKADQPLKVAFCDTFDHPAGDPTKRSGDLEPILWGVSRTNMDTNLGQSEYNEFEPAHLIGCGPSQVVLPPKDVRICNGRLVEAVNDGHGQPTVAMYPKQPFDIGGGRTGTVVFDVSADSQGPHATWPEFWWTDQPVPAAHGELAGQHPFARNSFGFSIAEQNCPDGQTSVDKLLVTRNFTFAEVPFTRTGCMTKGAVEGALNHIEVRINQNHVEIWGSDAGGDEVRQLAVADNANITMTKGLVWLEHVGYNACKFDTQCDHSFAWDNLGFDGPTPYRDLSFDVPDANVPAAEGRLRLGYDVKDPVTLKVDGVFRRQSPTGALVTFNWFPYAASVPSFRINGGPWHDTAWPFDPATFVWRTIGITVAADEAHDGSNTIEIKSADETVVSNINLILIAGAPVPG